MRKNKFSKYESTSFFHNYSIKCHLENHAPNRPIVFFAESAQLVGHFTLFTQLAEGLSPVAQWVVHFLSVPENNGAYLVKIDPYIQLVIQGMFQLIWLQINSLYSHILFCQEFKRIHEFSACYILQFSCVSETVELEVPSPVVS